MFSNEIFAERVRMLRKEKNIKQAELGKAVELSPNAISDIERGYRLTTMEKLVAIADYFNVSIDYLVGRTDKREVNK